MGWTGEPAAALQALRRPIPCPDQRSQDHGRTTCMRWRPMPTLGLFRCATAPFMAIGMARAAGDQGPCLRAGRLPPTLSLGAPSAGTSSSSLPRRILPGVAGHRSSPHRQDVKGLPCHPEGGVHCAGRGGAGWCGEEQHPVHSGARAGSQASLPTTPTRAIPGRQGLKTCETMPLR